MVEVENSASNRTDGDSHSAAETVVGTADSHREAQTCHVGGRFHGVTFNNSSKTCENHAEACCAIKKTSCVPRLSKALSPAHHCFVAVPAVTEA